MKHYLLKATFLTVMSVAISGFVKAETIVEYNNTNKPFVVADWTITGSGFANTNEVIVVAGDKATMAVPNAGIKYTNLRVELEFKNVNDAPSGSTTFDIELGGVSGESPLKITSAVSDNTGVPGRHYLNRDFNNTQGLTIKQLILSEGYIGITIIGLKITGTPANVGINDEKLASMDVRIHSDHLVLNSEVNGTMHVCNELGQIVGSYAVNKGENVIYNNTKGLAFLILTDNKEQLVGRKKIMR